MVETVTPGSGVATGTKFFFFSYDTETSEFTPPTPVQGELLAGTALMHPNGAPVQQSNPLPFYIPNGFESPLFIRFRDANNEIREASENYRLPVRTRIQSDYAFFGAHGASQTNPVVLNENLLAAARMEGLKTVRGVYRNETDVTITLVVRETYDTTYHEETYSIPTGTSRIFEFSLAADGISLALSLSGDFPTTGAATYRGRAN